MKKLAWVLVTALTIIFTPSSTVRAEAAKRGLLIVEVQTGSSTSASEEFIELYNQSEESINLGNYRIEYASASSTNFLNPSRVINLSGTLHPNGRYLATSTGYLAAQSNTNFGSTLAKTGGHLRLVSRINSQDSVHDLVGWGSAVRPEHQSADAPEAGESLQRKILSDGLYQDLDDNAGDFSVGTPTPESNNYTVPNPEEPNPTDPESEIPPENPEHSEEPALEIIAPEEPGKPILITELLPNPGSPGTDAEDEFIELYNPNNEIVDLRGYRLETGKDFSYHYTFDSQALGPQQYLVLYARDTNLVLSNTSGRARLLDQNGAVVSETSLYDEAKENLSWALLGETWQWTAQPTPNQVNAILSPAIAAEAAKAKKATTAKTTKPKAATKPKTAAAKTTKAKVASSKKSPAEQAATVSKPGVSGPVHPAILAGVGLLALGYAGYEYRADIANKFRQLRSFRKNRPDIGRQP